MKHSGDPKQGWKLGYYNRITVVFIDGLLMPPSLSWPVKENPIGTQGSNALSSAIYVLH